MDDLSILQIQDLSVCYKNKWVIQNLSLDLNQGERITVTGKSGSGKTSLIKCILGFTQPESGSIYIKGKKLTDKSVWILRQGIGFVPQEPDLGDQVVEQFLKSPFHFKANKNLHWDQSRVLELFQTFHLEEELLHKKTTLLSGGEKQRVALISAVILDRDFYILDEVTSALDDETRRLVIDYLNNREDLTFLFVTHDKDIKNISHRIYTFKKERGERTKS